MRSSINRSIIGVAWTVTHFIACVHSDGLATIGDTLERGDKITLGEVHLDAYLPESDSHGSTIVRIRADLSADEPIKVCDDLSPSSIDDFDPFQGRERTSPLGL